MANKAEVERYLRTIARTKKYKSHCLVGDFNLRNTSWPEGESSTEIERDFVEIFDELSLTQLIDRPTHEKGNTLDLLLTNVPCLISDVTILNQNEVCTSDHYGLTFNLGNVRRKKGPKRKIFNFKKANWDELNKDLKSVHWNSHLKFCEAHTAWLKFKRILLDLCQKHIPTVSIQSGR